jgi:hypothetical protein
MVQLIMAQLIMDQGIMAQLIRDHPITAFSENITMECAGGTIAKNIMDLVDQVIVMVAPATSAQDISIIMKCHQAQASTAPIAIAVKNVTRDAIANADTQLTSRQLENINANIISIERNC